MSDPRVVALGGGHGLAVSLAALRLITPNLTAVVTVADDGGSSGRIRAQLPVLPPGDLRMALAALAGQDAQASGWADAFAHRISGAGDLAGHPVGNLMLTGLMDRLGDPVAALDLAASLLGCVGRVLPMSCTPLALSATIRSGDSESDPASAVIGQHAVAISGGHVATVGLLPPDAPACPEAIAAIAEADIIVLGPGSWYSSVLPHLVLPELRTALMSAAARVVVTLNLVPQAGETGGFSPEEHIRVLRRYAPGLQIDTVLADSGAVSDPDALWDAVAQCGAELLLTSVADPNDHARHDPHMLADAYRGAFASSQYSQRSSALASTARFAEAGSASPKENEWP